MKSRVLRHECSILTPEVRLYDTQTPGPQSRQSAKLFLQSSELGLPNPSPAGECAPSYCDTLYIYVLCALVLHIIPEFWRPDPLGLSSGMYTNP